MKKESHRDESFGVELVLSYVEFGFKMRKWRSKEQGIDQESANQLETTPVETPASVSPSATVAVLDSNEKQSAGQTSMSKDQKPIVVEVTPASPVVPELSTNPFESSDQQNAQQGVEGSKKKQKRKKQPIHFSRINYSPIPGKLPTTMDSSNKQSTAFTIPAGPMAEANAKNSNKSRSWVAAFFKSRNKSGNLSDDKRELDEANEEEISLSESLEFQSKLKCYALQNKVSWKRFAVTCCPAMQTRNKILDHKLKVYGRRIILKALDLCPTFPNYATSFSASETDSSPCLLSPGTESIDLNENDYQVLPPEFEVSKKAFDVYDLEQLVMLLKNPFSTMNVPVENGICIGFVCPESSADEKNCIFKCDESFRSVKKSLGNWRCKAFTEHIAQSCKIIRRKQALNPIPFIYESWWFSDFLDAFKLDKEVSLCTITVSEVTNPEQPWIDGYDSILVCPLDKNRSCKGGAGARGGGTSSRQPSELSMGVTAKTFQASGNL